MTTSGAHPTDPAAAWANADLLAAKTLVYDPCGFACSVPIPEAESAAYAAHSFTVDGRAVRFRAARTTPTKAGQFVTLWKRPASGPIEPFDVGDPVDLFVVSTRDRDHLGQFVFPTEALRVRGVLSVDGSGGKRAFRVYPPWARTTSRQATDAQNWQLNHFLHAPPADPDRARMLYRQ